MRVLVVSLNNKFGSFLGENKSREYVAEKSLALCRVGGRYRMEEGEIEVDSIQPIGFPDITPELARESGFLGVLDLLKVAKHGRGTKAHVR